MDRIFIYYVQPRQRCRNSMLSNLLHSQADHVRINDQLGVEALSFYAKHQSLRNIIQVVSSSQEGTIDTTLPVVQKLFHPRSSVMVDLHDHASFFEPCACVSIPQNVLSLVVQALLAKTYCQRKAPCNPCVAIRCHVSRERTTLE